MNKPTIIMISAWKGSGKDTAADYLVKEFGFKRLGFADPLKDLCSSLFNVKRRMFDDAADKESPIMYMPVQAKDGFSKNVTDFMAKEFKTGSAFESEKYWTPRALAILVGSTMRSVNPDFWVEKAISQCQPGQKYVISDCRYKNEIESVKRAGANVITVRINRFDTSPSDDPSERDLDDYKFDVVINNKGTVTELQQAIKAVVE